MNFERQYFKKVELPEMGMEGKGIYRDKKKKIEEEMEEKFRKNMEEKTSQEKIDRLKKAITRNERDMERLKLRYPEDTELPIFMKLEEEKNKLKELLLKEEEKNQKE